MDLLRSTEPPVAPAFGGGRAELRDVSEAIRARPWLVVGLLGLAGLAWWSTAARMAGLDDGPGTDLGGLEWFLGLWAVMMAAMMLPSLVPAVALCSRMTRQPGPAQALLFTAGYLSVWVAAGAFAYLLFELGKTLFGPDLAWGESGRWIAGWILLLAAVYELTPLKRACLSRCRSPLAFLKENWRDGAGGAIEMGIGNAAWCVGCCWALMASLFALGVMSLTWMAFVAALVAIQKTLPWGAAAVWGAAGVLSLIACFVVFAPHDLPGLVVPVG